MATVFKEGMSLDEFMRTWDEEGPFELINEKKFYLPTKRAVHGSSANELAILMNQAAGESGKAYVEMVFVVPETLDSDWLTGSRIPDVAFFKADRLAAYKDANPDWRDKPFAIIPDLVVEIISSTDLWENVSAKIASYLADGVLLLWLVEPDQRQVTIYTPGSNLLPVLKAADKLTGGDVLPGFEVVVGRLFD